MITLTLFQVSTLLTAFVSLFLGLFVFFSGEKTKLNFSWLLASIFISLWSIGLFGVVFSTNIKVAWFWQYILDIGGICVPVMYFNFLLHLTKKNKKFVFLQISSLVAGSALIILNFTDLFKTGISPKFGINFWIDGGRLYFLFPFYFAFFAFLAVFFVIKEYYTVTDKDHKRQLMYVLLAQIFGFGGGLTDFFPQLFNIYPFGNYFIILYVIFISYAALKHHLFDIRIIATELLTFSIWAFLAIKTLLSVNRDDLMLNGGIFVAVVIAGILLIRSMLREVRQKEQIEKLASDIKRAYEVEKKANDELEKLDKYKNDFLVQTQHDLKNPLTVIMGYSDMLLSGRFGKVPKKGVEIIERMQAVVKDAIKDVSNFLDTEQFKMGKGVVLLKPNVELFGIFEEIIEKLREKAESKQIYLKLEKPEKSIIVSADREKLKSALFNIIDNSVKYTEEGGVDIKIKIEKFKNLKIIISDTGIGIPKDKLNNILSMQFERTKQAKNTAEGSGVGLRLAAQIIKLHNGKIWAESAGEGKGSTFYIELPTK